MFDEFLNSTLFVALLRVFYNARSNRKHYAMRIMSFKYDFGLDIIDERQNESIYLHLVML